MASIRITQFAGLLPQVNPKALENDHAQVAHNCLLWDGWLHPMPQWVLVANLPWTPAGLYKTNNNSLVSGGVNLNFNADYNFANGVQNIGEPYNSNRLTGIFVRDVLGKYLGHYLGSGFNAYLGVPAPTIGAHSFTISPGNQSKYPISRTYAVTALSYNQEGPPTVFEQIGTNGTLFEGDGVLLQATVDTAQLIQYGITAINVYRTIPGFDTGEELGNPIETGFHYIGTVAFGPGGPPGGAFSFYDGLESSKIQGDLLISDQWIPPPSDTPKQPIFFGQTEGGWSVLARYDGTVGGAPNIVQFSERFMLHAWPMQNTISIPELITDIAIYYDDIFIGTQNIAYHIRIEAGETETLNLQVRRFVNEYACLPNTMVSTNFGAMYASADGLIALTTDGDKVTSKAVASPGDQLIVPLNIRSNTFVFFRLSDALQSAWWNGNYYGFTHKFSQYMAYVFNQPSPSNQEFPLGQLVTIDRPAGDVVDSISTGAGLFISVGSNVYTFPLPGYGYDAAPKATYTWLSKRYVMSGLTNFAGMKIVNDNTGNLTLTLYGYNIGGSGNIGSPNFVYTRTLNHSKPFRLPHNQHCMEWEIQVKGTAVIEEIHLSTSYQDLVEVSNNG